VDNLDRKKCNWCLRYEQESHLNTESDYIGNRECVSNLECPITLSIKCNYGGVVVKFLKNVCYNQQSGELI
jgi:hypothetical protein